MATRARASHETETALALLKLAVARTQITLHAPPRVDDVVVLGGDEGAEADVFAKG